MTIGRIVVLLFWGALLALVVAVFNGEDQLFSLQLWLALFIPWLAITVLFQLFGVLPLVAEGLVGLWPIPRRTKKDGGGRGVPELRAIESLVLRARDNVRVHNQQLRPRLTVLAEHFLPMYHGVNPVVEPQRAASVLGDVGWLIDPDIDDRAPTIPELRKFVALVTGTSTTREDSP